MKQTIIASIMLLAVPFFASASSTMVTGFNPTTDCISWRQGMPLVNGQPGNAYNGKAICETMTNSYEATAKRIVTLENAVRELQDQVSELRASQGLTVASSAGVESDDSLDSRVSALETKMSGVQTFLQTVVSMLSQKL